MLKFYIGSEKEILVGRFEMVSNAHDGLPNVALFGRVRVPMLYGVCGVKHGAVDLRKIGPPEVKRVNNVVGMCRTIGLDKARCDRLRC